MDRAAVVINEESPKREYQGRPLKMQWPFFEQRMQRLMDGQARDFPDVKQWKKTKEEMEDIVSAWKNHHQELEACEKEEREAAEFMETYMPIGYRDDSEGASEGVQEEASGSGGEVKEMRDENQLLKESIDQVVEQVKESYSNMEAKISEIQGLIDSLNNPVLDLQVEGEARESEEEKKAGQAESIPINKKVGTNKARKKLTKKKQKTARGKDRNLMGRNQQKTGRKIKAITHWRIVSFEEASEDDHMGSKKWWRPSEGYYLDSDNEEIPFEQWDLTSSSETVTEDSSEEDEFLEKPLKNQQTRQRRRKAEGWVVRSLKENDQGVKTKTASKMKCMNKDKKSIKTGKTMKEAIIGVMQKAEERETSGRGEGGTARINRGHPEKSAGGEKGE